MSGLTINDPAKFADVIKSTKIIPGDVLLLRGGTYKGDWDIEIGGSSELPIKIMPYQNEHVIIDGWTRLLRSNVWLQDLELMDSDLNRVSDVNTSSLEINGSGFSVVGCLVHDLHDSGIFWFGSGPGQIVECVIYNNGGRWTTGGGYGHGIYTHNNGGGARLISRNIFFDQIGDYTFQVYSGGQNYLLDYTIQDNIICGDPSHTGGGLGLRNYVYERNWQYQDYSQQGRYSMQPNDGGIIRDNVFIELNSYSVQSTFKNLQEYGNLVYGGEPSNRAGYTVIEQPATLVRVIPFSLSARWLASVAIFNRDSAPSVLVDFAGALKPGTYKLVNGQNPTETWQFEYGGALVDVPTNWTSTQRIGDSLPPSTWPRFGGLVVER